MKPEYNNNEFYRAHLARDPRFDGKFFVAVNSTKIYCRPTCPAKKAKLENLRFYIHAAQAEEAGYRPCLRCRPETAPGSAAWLGTSATVQRAIRLMDNQFLEELTIKALAEKLGIGERWLRELFQTQVGASPQSVLMTKKLDLARNLLDSSSLSITDIALSSGFNSVRRFNDAFKKRFNKTPSEFKVNSGPKHLLQLHLAYRPPYAWQTLLNFFAQRTLTGMELVENNRYQRLITHQDIKGWLMVELADNNSLKVTLKLNKTTNILDFVTRVKNMFDIDADLMAIENDLSHDRHLKPLLKRYPGLRVPGCWDGFELAVRAIVGQKISVKGARTILNRMVDTYGDEQDIDPNLPLEKFFPSPEKILAADLSSLGLTTVKIGTIKALAQAIVDGELILDGTADYQKTCQTLLSIKGIGPWTVQYIAMRMLKNPNAFPETDLEIKKQIARFNLDPQQWAPWKAYAAILLFNLAGEK